MRASMTFTGKDTEAMRSFDSLRPQLAIKRKMKSLRTRSVPLTQSPPSLSLDTLAPLVIKS